MKLKKSGKITHTITLSGKDILEMLPELGTDYAPGNDATITFKVPTGGDYSGTSVNFEDDERITVTWTTRSGDD